MTVWNVLAAAAASWVFGLIWYRAFAERRAPLAKTAASATGKPVGVASLGIAILSALVLIVAAGFLRHIYYVSGLTSGVPLGLVAGMGVGLYFIAPWMWMTHLADGRPFRLTLIDGGFATLATAIMGALLVAF
ncbi:MAG: DUF1761 domain-containing protein [Pseudomonadota bacterium]|nr:DUF1761 domain-containing protein [Pseudomonadota bacterium]